MGDLMALKKEIVIDLIQILEDGTMQIRQATRVEENEKELGKTYHRHCISPSQNIDKEDSRVKLIANALWTSEVIAAYQAKVAAANID